MKSPAIIATIVAALACAAAASSPSGDVVLAEDVAAQARTALEGLPMEVQRVAIQQFRGDSREFQPAVARYIQSQVEEGLAHEGRHTVVNAPELKTIRVVSTDTSLSVSSNLPSSEAMQKIAEKLNVDGFLQGSISRNSEDGITLSLRLVRASTNVMVWSATFRSGPNWKDDLLPGIDLSVHTGLRLFPMKGFVMSGTNYQNAKLATNFDIECSIGEAITENKRFSFETTVGYSYLSVFGLPDSMTRDPCIHMIRLGVQAQGALWAKDDPRRGYWVGTYVGFDDLIPVMQRHEICALRFGLCSKPTRHFTISAGVVYIPFGNTVVDIPGSGHNIYKLDKVAYEIDFLHYTF